MAVQERTMLQAWVSPELAAQLRERARADERSISASVRMALKSYLATREKQPA